MINYKKILFGQQGRYGDICMNVPVFNVLKKEYAKASLHLLISKDFIDIAPLFYNQKNIDGVFIIDTTIDFPNKLDIENIKNGEFDYIYHPLCKGPEVKNKVNECWSGNWFNFYNPVEYISYRYGLPICSKKIDLHQWWPKEKINNKLIAFHPTPASYSKNNGRTFSEKKTQQIVNDIKKLGFDILQVGHQNDKKLNNTMKIDTDFFNSIKNILKCRLFIGGDSGLTWALSGYNFPTIGCYSKDYYKGYDSTYQPVPVNNLINLQPTNPNAQYLEASTIDDIPNELIIEKIKGII